MLSSPEQHILDAVNRICLRSGSGASCLERLTRPSEVTIRLYDGLPVPVWRDADVVAVRSPEWITGAAVNVTMEEVTIELCCMVVVVACTLAETNDMD